MHNLFFLTVRHTGTRFGFKFLSSIGLNSGSGYFHLHVSGAMKRDMTPESTHGYLLKEKVLVMARDPLLGALRVSGQMANVKSSQNNVDGIASEWNSFIDLLPNINHHIIDIGCPEAMRYEHLCDAARFVGVDPDRWSDLKQYAENWTPTGVNTENHEIKARYLENGTLPSQIDYSGLDRAVAWYKNLPTN
jgi:hypothetical protein